MIMMLRRGCSWKRVEAFPGLGIALSLLTVLVYQVSSFNIQCLGVQMLAFNSIVTTPLNAKSPKHFHSHILVFPVWKCSCQKDDCKYICDGLLERDLSGAPGDFFYLPVRCILSSSIYQCIVFYCLCVQYAPPLIHSGQNPFPRNKLPLLAIRWTVKQFDVLSESKFKIGQSSRAIGDALNMMCHFYALNILPLGDVMMIAAVRVPSCQNVYMITILFPGDHCQPLLLHFPEGTLWGLWDPQHLHRNQHSCHIWIFCCQHRVTFSFSLSSFFIDSN